MAKTIEDTKIDLSRLFGFAQVERVSSTATDATELHSKVGDQETGHRETTQGDSELDQVLELHSKVGVGEN